MRESERERERVRERERESSLSLIMKRNRLGLLCIEKSIADILKKLQSGKKD